MFLKNGMRLKDRDTGVIWEYRTPDSNTVVMRNVRTGEEKMYSKQEFNALWNKQVLTDRGAGN